jgi:dTDP-4-amino-4,6-dideoxygalactose transaminase
MNSMHVPILDLTRQYETIKPAIDAAVTSVLASGRFILGPEVETFEEEVARYCGAKYAIGVASGTDALFLSLKALGIGPGDRVILPSFTFFATAGVVYNVGAIPVFADIDPQTFTMDVEDAKRKITPRTKAILPVDFYGHPAPIPELMELADEHGLVVIEDACQASTAEINGQKLGGIAHFTAFSWSGKPIYATGGGAAMPVMHGASMNRDGSVKGGPYSHGAYGNPKPEDGQYAVVDVTDTGGGEICVHYQGKRLPEGASELETLIDWETCFP